MAVYRNANWILLFLVLLNLVVISGTFLFFEKSFEGIKTRYEAKTENLRQVEADLNAKFKTLQTAQKDIRAKQQSEEMTAVRYKEVSAHKQTIEQEIVGLEEDKKRLSGEMSAQTAATADMKAKEALALAQNSRIKSEIGLYNEEIRQISQNIALVDARIAQLRSEIASS